MEVFLFIGCDLNRFRLCLIEQKLQVVPDDNSCLFSSVALIFEQDILKAPKMRKSKAFHIILRRSHSNLAPQNTVIADGIKADPSKYNEAILG